MFSYPYLKTDTLTNDVNPIKLESEINLNQNITSEINHILGRYDGFDVVFKTEPAAAELTELKDVVIANHEHITTAESLRDYLDTQVFPFISELIHTFAAENIAMGITQAGKTGEVLGIFEERYSVGYVHPVSLKGSFDTGSLYVSLEVLQHVRDNPNEYTGLAPFVTDARLLEMKNKIETFLGVTPLST